MEGPLLSPGDLKKEAFLLTFCLPERIQDLTGVQLYLGSQPVLKGLQSQWLLRGRCDGRPGAGTRSLGQEYGVRPEGSFTFSACGGIPLAGNRR